MLSVSFTNPSPVQSLSDCKPFLTAFLCWIASFWRFTKSVWVVKYCSDTLKEAKTKNKKTRSHKQRCNLINDIITISETNEAYYPLKSSIEEKLCFLIKFFNSSQSFFTRPYPCIITPVHTCQLCQIQRSTPLTTRAISLSLFSFFFQSASFWSIS